MSGPERRLAIFGFGGLDEPEAGASIAQALRAGWNGGLKIHAFGRDATMTGAWISRVADHLHLAPQPQTTGDRLVQCLLQRHEVTPFDAVVPTLEADALALRLGQDRLTEAGIACLLPDPGHITPLLDGRWSGLLRGLGFKTAPALRAAESDELSTQCDLLGYPLLVKGATPAPRLVHSSSAARALVEAAPRNGRQVLLQCALGGEGFRVALVFDRKGESRGLVAMRKLSVNEEGRLVCGAVVEDKAVVELALEVAASLSWRGALEIEIARPAGTSDLLITDLSCRLPDWSLLTHWAGCNLPVAYLQALLADGKSATARGRPGTMMLRGVTETAVPLDDMLQLARRGSLNGGAWHRTAFQPKPAGDDGLSVALTGLSTFDVVNPGLGVARCLRQSPLVGALQGLCYGTLASGAYQPELCHKVHNLAFHEDSGRLLDRLMQIREQDPFDVLLPNLDGELPQFIEIADRLAAQSVSTLLPSMAALEQRSKLGLCDWKPRNSNPGFEIPGSRIATSEDELLEELKQFGYPAAVKGPVCQFIAVRNEAEARAAWKRLRHQENDKVIIQALIEGESVAVAGLCDRAHTMRCAVAIRKLAHCSRGSTWSALALSEPQLVEGFAAFLRELAWVGPVEGEFICDKLSGRFHLIEVNPRFTGWISYSAALGQNHPEIAVALAAGRDITPQPPRQDMAFMRASQDIQVRPGALASLSNRGFLRHG